MGVRVCLRFRVPLIVVSPYAKAKYISHVNHDFGSILNFVERTFGLSSLGYADAATTDDFSDCFDLQQSPMPFQVIAAPLGADYFHTTRTRQPIRITIIRSRLTRDFSRETH